MSSLEDLLKEIAVKHGIAVSRDDPIMILKTINERLLRDSATAQQEALQQFKSEVEEVAQRWQVDALDKSQRVLAAALVEARKLIERETVEAVKKTVDAARLAAQDEIKATMVPLRAAHDRTARLVAVNVISAALAFGAAFIAFVASL